MKTPSSVKEVGVIRAGPPAGGPDDAATGPPSTPRVQSVERAVTLLRAVARTSGPAARVAALAHASGVNRATAWRILITLESEGLVDCDRRTGQWSISEGMQELAGITRESTVRGAARPVLQEVAAASGETAAVAIMQPEGLTYIDEVAPTSVVAATWQGRAVPLHATSTGKAWLAAQSDGRSDDASVDHLILPLQRFTDTTIVARGALSAELEETRRRGYGVCRGEYEATAYGVSAAVQGTDGRVVAVLSIWGPGARLGAERFPEAGTIVVAGAQRVSARLAPSL